MNKNEQKLRDLCCTIKRTNMYIMAIPEGERKERKDQNIANNMQDFPGGTVNKNPPANAGDMGSVPGLGRFHTPQSN